MFSVTAAEITKTEIFDGTKAWPVQLVFRKDGDSFTVFLSYPQAIDLSRKLRVAAGVDEVPQEEAA